MARPARGPAEVRYHPLSELVRWPRNPKLHDLPGIRRSIERFGFVLPLVLDEGTGRLVAGHGRLEVLSAMRAEGLPLPGNLIQHRDGDWQVPVLHGCRFADEQEAEAYLLADNQLVVTGGWDEVALREMLRAQVATENPARDIRALGWRPGEVEALLREAQTPPGADKDDDGPDPRVERAQQLREKWGVQKGDLWIAGAHRLVCGDCQDPQVIQRALGSEEPPPLLLTDPPYCSGGWQESGRSAGSWGEIAADTLSTRGYQALIRGALQAARPQTVYIFTDWRMWTPLFDVVESAGLAVRMKITWDKETPSLGVLWRTQSEEILFASRGKSARRPGQPGSGNVLRCRRSGNQLHYTEKPVELLRMILACDEGSPREKCRVLDLFAGSGSVSVAAHLEGRPSSSVEVEPAICAVVVERWAEMGLAPERVATAT